MVLSSRGCPKASKIQQGECGQAAEEEAADTDLADAIDRGGVPRTDWDIQAEVVELEKKLANVLKMSQKAQDERSSVLAAGGGDRERLSKEITDTQRRIEELRELRARSVSRQRDLLNSADLYNTMIAPILAENAKLYDVLRAERKIPNVVPELVRERLEKRVCICGASLEAGTTGYEP